MITEKTTFLKIGRHVSGQDSGELDYSISWGKITELNDNELMELVKLIREVHNKVIDQAAIRQMKVAEPTKEDQIGEQVAQTTEKL